MAQITYRGAVQELVGTVWDVPDAIPLTQKAAWIESAARQAELEAAAQEEQQAREAEVLAARLEKAKNDTSIEKLTNEITELAQGLEELNQRIVAEPDTSAQLQFNAAAADIYNRSLGLADEVAAMQATVTDLLTRATAMAEAAAVGEELQQQALDLLRNQQAAMNGSFETYSAELERLSLRTNNAIVEVQELNTEAQDNRDVIQQAANIQEDAVNIAQQAAREEIQETREQFLDLMALSLRALGLRESDLIATANAIEVAPNDSGTIRRATVERFIEVSSKTNAAIEQARGEVVG